MRLYLSSFRLGDAPDELVRLFGRGKRIAIIANAVDLASDDERAMKVQAEHNLLNELGFQTEEIDLRDYFSKEDELRETLNDFDGIWVRGGNVFLLRRAFKQSGFDGILKELLKKNEVAYGGYSAGICILSPTLKGLELVDEPYDVAAGYAKGVIWDGLSIVPYSIAPHYKSDHPESAQVDKCVAYFEKHKIPFKPLTDGEVIVIG
jgi:dipeptidase E